MKNMMHSLLVLVFALTASCAFAVELQDATNQQILDELALRLRLGGGIGGDSAAVTYLCDSSSYLKVSIVGPSGTETARQFYTGSSDYCSRQRTILNASRSRINRTTIVAVCDSSSYLKRFSITEQGVTHDLASNYVGNTEACFDQARTVNSAN